MDLTAALARRTVLRTPPAGLLPYLAAVVLLGGPGALVALAGTDWPALVRTTTSWSLLFLVLASLAGEVKPLRVAKGQQHVEAVSTSTPFVLAVVVVGGVGPAVATAAVVRLVGGLQRGRGVRRSASAAARAVVGALAARAVLCAFTGAPFLGGPSAVGVEELLALLAAGVVMVLVDRALLALALAGTTGRPVATLLREDLGSFAATQAVLLCLGGVAAHMAADGIAFLALLLAPALAVHLATAAGLRAAHQAAHDPLTGLGNRTRLHRTLGTALDADAPVGLVLLDLDHFRDINDALGHGVGDELLQVVAQRLTTAVDGDAPAHRLGGDEFAVVVPGGLARVQRVALDLLAALDEPVRVRDLDVLVRASAGVAVAPEHGTDADTLLKRADVALYHAKVERNRMSTYTDRYDVSSVERLQLLTDLRTAIETGELGLVYQPQVDLGTGRVVAVEALIRWDHPTRGTIHPDEFIPLAENSGLIAEVTTHVLGTALADLAEWHATGLPVRVAVNVSARHLSDLTLPRTVNLALARHDLPSRSLLLEVTENALLADQARSDVVLAALRAIGVGVAVDDYGTGHASLGYLKRLRVDELKIDKSFVSTMGVDPRDFMIVRSTVALATDLGLRVVAEGVEDEMTVEVLRSLGCHVAQGYHLGRPMSAADVARRVAAELPLLAAPPVTVPAPDDGPLLPRLAGTAAAPETAPS